MKMELPLRSSADATVTALEDGTYVFAATDFGFNDNNDLPNKNTVRHYHDRFRDDGTWERVHDLPRADARVAAGKEPTPSAAVVDSQSVTATEKRGRGPRGTTPGRRSATAASGTSSSTRWG